MSIEISPLGIFSWYGFVLPFRERIALIKEAGFAGTSLWWEDDEEPFPLRKEQMPSLVRERGLTLENIHVPWCAANDLWSEKREVREKILYKHRGWLEDCAQFDIPLLVMHLCDGDNPPAPNKHGLKSMEELVRGAEDLGVKIALENTRRSDSVAYVLEHISSRALGFCFDSSHHRLTDQGDYELLRVYGDRLLTTHLSDNDGSIDRHWLPGNGIIDWEKVCTSFPKSYQGFLTLEAYPNHQEAKGTPQDFLQRAYERVKNIEKLIKGNQQQLDF